jgi:hypothetical protein
VSDLKFMGQLGARLNDLARVPSRAASGAAAGINEALRAQFEDGVDPYGAPWAKLADRTLLKHDEPPLQGEFGARPGDMASGVYAAPLPGAGIGITVPFPGGIHQTGADRGNWHMPARKILPERQMPGAWKQAIDSAIAEAMSGSLKGR